MLLFQALWVTSLDRGLPQAPGQWWATGGRARSGKIITDLPVAVALGGELPGRYRGARAPSRS